MGSEIDINGREEENIGRIRGFKAKLGDSLVILGHQYQRQQIVELSDFVGDSYALSAKAAASTGARYIVFCGVAFMAESAEILRSPGQTVYHPNFSAGCPMADMAAIDDVEEAYQRVSSTAAGKVIPIVYMNSNAAVKAFCGRHGGLVCTSANADAAMKWAFGRGKVVLFMPDEHLGTNTADALHISQAARTLYDPEKDGGGDCFRVDEKTRLVLWKGHCHVHTFFTVDQVRRARERHPGCTVIVHPECPQEIIGLSDVVGSTTKIVKAVEEAPPGATLVVGTEVNLVDRLAREQEGRKKVVALERSFCPNMFRINLSNLCATLENLDNDRYRVSVPEDVKRDAATSLQRMLDIS
jgi:quinolinate synthase